MNLITVIPLTRSKVAETLSYFTSSEVPIGAIVSVPLRSKTIQGITIETRSVADMKTEIKTAPYEIRRAGKVKASAFFPISFMKACGELANYYATNIGTVIGSIVSGDLLENANKIIAPRDMDPKPDDGPIMSTKQRRIYATQGDNDDRISSWRSLIRQEFAKKKSVVFYVPTIENARALFITLHKGIEDYIFELHGNITKKVMIDTWQKIAETEHPIVIVATGSFPILPRSDIDTVIIEKENDRGWISQRSPYIDMRHAVEYIAMNGGKILYLSDNMLRIETLWHIDNGEIEPGSTFKWRSVSSARDSLVDMVNRNTKHKPDNTEDKDTRDYSRKANPFRVISPELISLIEKNHEDNSHLFIFAVRRGLSSITICDDCETIVNCHACSAPVILHASQKSSKNFFMCHKCGETMSADILCKNCNGFRLTPLGIGIDRVEREILDRFHGIEIIKIDSDDTKTEKQITHAMDRFRDKPGSILLGTEMALSRIRDKVDHIAVASLDSLFALPDFRISEKIMRTLVQMRSLASQTILVQTRHPEEKIFQYGLKGNLSDFYRDILTERKQFSYPPFSMLIKISIEGKKDSIATNMAEVREILKPREIDIFPAFTSTTRNNSIIHGLMKIPKGEWPDTEIIRKLRTLEPNVSVRIDPESLL